MHDLVVLSDLHLGRGVNPDSGRHHVREAFFYDSDFLQFCTWACNDADKRGVPFKLVLNGDVFDLLRTEPDDHRGHIPDNVELRYGPVQTPKAAAHLVEDIMSGHPHFVKAWALVLARGNEIVVLPGNHDIETQWESVRKVVRDAVEEELVELGVEDSETLVNEGLQFREWFYYEEGRCWIEHGSQYDPENSFRYYLRSGLGQATDAIIEAEQDVPLGSFFQRYLYNKFGHITFIVPSSRAHLRYFKWLLLNQPRLLFRVATSHGPFLWQVLRRMARFAGHELEEIRDCHEAEIARLSTESGLGETLYEIERLKEVRDDMSNTVHEVGQQALKLLAAMGFVALVTAGLWFAGFHTINQLQSGFGLKAFLFLLLNFLFLAGAVGGVAYATLRAPAAGGGSPRPLRGAAEQIANKLDVPIITFGHTHDEVLWRLKRASPGKKSFYYNTGTWIAVFTHDVFIPRERVQFTFLRIKEKEAQLLHWSPSRGEPVPVILIDDEDDSDEETRTYTAGPH